LSRRRREAATRLLRTGHQCLDIRVCRAVSLLAEFAPQPLLGDAQGRKSIKGLRPDSGDREVHRLRRGHLGVVVEKAQHDHSALDGGSRIDCCRDRVAGERVDHDPPDVGVVVAIDPGPGLPRPGQCDLAQVRSGLPLTCKECGRAVQRCPSGDDEVQEPLGRCVLHGRR